MKEELKQIGTFMARCAGTLSYILEEAAEIQRNYDRQVIKIAQLTGDSTQAKAIAHGKKLQELEQIAFWLAEGCSLEDAVRYVKSD